jgi:hypothetical protein
MSELLVKLGYCLPPQKLTRQRKLTMSTHCVSREFVTWVQKLSRVRGGYEMLCAVKSVGPSRDSELGLELGETEASCITAHPLV